MRKYLAAALLFALTSCTLSQPPATPTALVTVSTMPTVSIVPTVQPTDTMRPVSTIAITWTPRPSYTPAPTYTMLPSLTPRPTYTPYPTATQYPTSTPRPTQPFLGGRIQRAHPLPMVDAENVVTVNFIEYVCFTDHFYGIADGQNFWVHDDPEGYKLCVGAGKAMVRRSK